MPFGVVALRPGVNVEATPTLNEAGYSSSSLIRYRDGLAQKIGGWEKFYALPVSGIPRDLHAWQDLNDVGYLASGSTTQLGVISGGLLQDITPQTLSSDFTPDFSTTASSATVTIVDPNIANVTTFDSVYFATPVAVGGIVLSGIHPITAITGASEYEIEASSTATLTRTNATITGITQANPAVVTTFAAHGFSNGDLIYIADVVGMTQVNNLIFTIANVTGTTFELSGTNSTGYTAWSSGGIASPASVPFFATTSGSTVVQVTLQDHGLAVDDVVVFSVPTTVGGITISGTYTVNTVSSVDVFAIRASIQASSTASAPNNSGDAQLIYYITSGPSAGGAGYGLGTYGTGGFGTGIVPSSQTGDPITSTDWTLDNWGQILMGCPFGGGLYFWSPSGGFTTASLITGGPLFNSGMFVSTQAQILIAYGASEDKDIGIDQDPLLIRNSDQEDFTVWTESLTNQARRFRIPTGSRIVGGAAGPRFDLIWTDLDLWIMEYVGFPLVYTYNKVGTSCGLIAEHAQAMFRGVTYWMGQTNFYVYGGSGGGVEIIPCTVWDAVFQDLDMENASKIRCCPNTPFNEIIWQYPSISGGTGENDRSVSYNVVEGAWVINPLPARTAWIDQSVLGNPIGATSTSIIYQHEEGYDNDGAPITSTFTTGYFDIGEGEDYVFVDQWYPDMKFGTYAGTAGAQITVTFNVVNYPGDTPRVYGPYLFTSTTQYIQTRFRGAQVSITFTSSDSGSFWRIGKCKYRFSADGKR